MESAIFGFLGVIIGALIAVFKDYYFKKKKDEKDAKYLATLVSFELERYASARARDTYSFSTIAIRSTIQFVMI